MGGVQLVDSWHPVSAPEEAVLDYNKTHDDKYEPSKDKFQPDLFTTLSAKSAWNLRLFEIFLGDYAKGCSNDNVNDLSNYFMTYLQSLQISHCKMTTTTGGRTVYEVSLQRGRIEKRKKTVISSLSISKALDSRRATVLHSQMYIVYSLFNVYVHLHYYYIAILILCAWAGSPYSYH